MLHMPDAEFNREPHTATFVSNDKLDAMVSIVSRWLEELKQCRQATEKLDLPGLAIHGMKSWDVVVQRIRPVITGCEESRLRAVDGAPMKPGERKPRSRLVDKAESIVDEYRTSTGLSYVAEPKDKPTKKAPKKKG